MTVTVRMHNSMQRFHTARTHPVLHRGAAFYAVAFLLSEALTTAAGSLATPKVLTVDVAIDLALRENLSVRGEREERCRASVMYGVQALKALEQIEPE